MGDPTKKRPGIQGLIHAARAWIWRQRVPLVAGGGAMLAATALLLPKRFTFAGALLGAAVMLGSIGAGDEDGAGAP